MADNSSRFVIIDGMQIARTRALSQGLIDDQGNIVKRQTPGTADPELPTGEPKSTRARSSESTRKA